MILAFNDSECTTVCPLTTTAMLDAKAMLGKAGSQVQLLGVDANPAAISLEDVWSYSELHGMLHSWRFLTGSLPELKQVWKDYGIEAAIEAGEITHTPALFVIGRQGRLSRLYVTQMSYTAVPQMGQLLAQSAAALLPGKPRVHDGSLLRPHPADTTERAGDGAPRRGRDGQVGPGKSARLFVFFATWDQETSGLAGELDSLNGYQQLAVRTGLPQLTAVDEASVEPSLKTPTEFIEHLPHPLSYPVALDQSGKLADGYEVLGLPWFVLTSSTGQLLYYREVSTAGWPSTTVLVRYVKAALARVVRSRRRRRRRSRARRLAAVARLAPSAGRPAPWKPIRACRAHPRAARLSDRDQRLGVVVRAVPVGVRAVRRRVRRYGRRVAFLGADTDDSAGDARTFLAAHPVSYPSYQTSTSNMTNIVPQGVGDLPTTIFINRAGKVVYVHTGQYDSEGTLDQDISSYAVSG